ncbi:hypothetical protein FQZ97_1133280 [compost metagenome]
MDFGARIAVGPEAVAGGDGAVGLRVVPAVFAGGREAHGALLQVQARHASGRVLLRAGRRTEAQQHEAEQPSVQWPVKIEKSGAVHGFVSGSRGRMNAMDM